MRIYERCTATVVALILCGAWMPAMDFRKEFALHLQPLVPGYVITATMVCGSGYNECLKEAARAKLLVSRLTAKGNGEPVEEYFTHQPKDRSIVYTLRGRALCPGDQVTLQYAEGDPSGTEAVMLSDHDFKNAVQLGPDKHSVAVYFPSTELLTMRVEDANGLKQPPIQVAPKFKNGLWVAEFAGIPNGTGLKLVFSVGASTNRREYPAYTIPDLPVSAALKKTLSEEASGNIQGVAQIQDKDVKDQWTDKPAPPITHLAAYKEKPSPAARVPPQQDLQSDTASTTPTAAAEANPPATPVAKPDPPATVIQVVEGASAITGYDKRFEKVRVDVMEGEDVLEQSEAAVDKDTGKFTATLLQPVGVDQTLKVFGLSGDNVSEPRTVGVLPAEMNWGRVRAYFTLGVLISAPGTNQLNGSTASPFLALTVDKNWLRPRTAMQQRVRLNTFFDARLTSIAAVTDNSKGTAVVAFPTATNVLADKHAGSLQVGMYVPVILSNYIFRNHPYSLYAAPLAKVGFYQLTDSTTDANGNTTLNNASFYKFHAYGLRIGHYKEYVDWQGRGNTHHSPDQLSYIEFTVGKWGNYEYARTFVPNAQSGACTADPVQGGTTPSCATLRQQAWRYGFEGILRIPYTPFILGLSANLSAQRLHLPGFTAPGDDLRFLFGMRFDSRKLLNGIAKIGGN
jgi:hypothetical protein